MKEIYQTPEIEIIEFDMEVQMMMTVSGGLGENFVDSNENGWED